MTFFFFTTESYRLRADDDRTRVKPDVCRRLATFIVHKHNSRGCNPRTSGRSCPRKSWHGETSQETGNEKNRPVED